MLTDEENESRINTLPRLKQRRRKSENRSISKRMFRKSSLEPSQRRSRDRSINRCGKDELQDRRRRCRRREQKGSKRRSSNVSTTSSSSESESYKRSNDYSSSRKRRHRSKETRLSDNMQNVTVREILDILKTLPSPSSQNHFSMNNNAVPEFDPSNREQTINIWINKVEECSKLYNWNEIQLLHYALPKLSGVASIWYQGLPSVNFTWSEWKEKLLKTFPSVENYAVLLNEMLERKVRYNETLENYFYHKVNLLNRCEIYNKKAVDCIIYGLDDRGMRLGAQAGNYSQPEQLLAYLKTVKIDDAKENRRPVFKRNHEFGNESIIKTTINTIKCFNCGEVGHPSFKCSKPLLSCNICKRLGHLSSTCKSIRGNNDNSNRNTERISEEK
jgi:hypothetical protein